MRHSVRRPALALSLFLAACASAGDRFEQGLEAEAYGRLREAAFRYVEALEKDAALASARARLQTVGDSVVKLELAEARTRQESGDAVAAAEGYRAVDELLDAAGAVGIRLARPDDYGTSRRAAFDGAIEALLAAGEEYRAGGAWQDGRRSLRRARRTFEPDGEQERRLRTAEARLLADWAGALEAEGRFQEAFRRAEEALETPGGAPDDVAEAAAALQDRAVEAGTRRLVVFPVMVASDVDPVTEEDPAMLLSETLELDHWRTPPLFVAVADPLEVRRLTRRLSPPGTALRPRRVLDATGADFGLVVEIGSLTVTEGDVARQVRTARTSRGGTRRWTLEEGHRTYRVRVRMELLDERGRVLDRFSASADARGPFRRGLYDGDPRELELSRNERRLFDPRAQAEARAALEEELMAELAGRIATGTFERVLRRIP